jgi:hypothetical protein
VVEGIVNKKKKSKNTIKQSIMDNHNEKIMQKVVHFMFDPSTLPSSSFFFLRPDRPSSIFERELLPMLFSFSSFRPLLAHEIHELLRGHRYFWVKWQSYYAIQIDGCCCMLLLLLRGNKEL